MRKASFTILACLLAGLLLAACSSATAPAEQTETTATEEPAVSTEQPEETVTPSPSPEPTPVPFSAPSDIMNETFNPFYSIELPEGYNVYQMSFWIFDEQKIAMYLTAEDTAENVVGFFAQLLDYGPEDIEYALDDLAGGYAILEPNDAGCTLNAQVGIQKTSEDDGEYTYVEGYKVTIKADIDPDMLDIYEDILDQNFNTDAISYFGAGDFLIDNAPVGRQIVIQTGESPRVQTIYTYRPDDYETWKAFFTSDEFCSNRFDNVQSDSALVCDTYADMTVQAHLDYVSGEISFFEILDRTDLNLTDYIPETTLSFFRFGEIDTDGTCSWTNSTETTFIVISKTDWQGEDDSIMLLGGDEISYKIVYTPADKTYAVLITTGDTEAKYYYHADTGVMEPMDEGWEVEGILNRLNLIVPDADDPVMYAIDVFDQTIADTVAMTPDELFALEY